MSKQEDRRPAQLVLLPAAHQGSRDALVRALIAAAEGVLARRRQACNNEDKKAA